VSLYLLVFAIIPLAIIAGQFQVEAAEYSYKGKVVGIVIEKSCLISDRCLNYSDVIPLDNTDPRYMGKFVEKNGDYTRQATSNQNNYRWLEFQKGFTVVVDPPLKFRTQIPIITIVSKLDEYHLEGQKKITELNDCHDCKALNKVRTYSHTRYVDATCTNAVITAKNWKTVLPDTINYLRNNCDPAQTTIQSISYEIKPLTKHDISTSSKSKLDKFYAKVKSECLKTRNACTVLENRAVSTMQDES
jgi:hypothetical protein